MAMERWCRCGRGMRSQVSGGSTALRVVSVGDTRPGLERDQVSYKLPEHPEGVKMAYFCSRTCWRLRLLRRRQIAGT